MSLSTYFYDAFPEPFLTVSDFSRLFDAALDARTPGATRDTQPRQDGLTPRMDVHESKDQNEITMTMELPGMRKEDVGIDVRNNRLVVAGQTTRDDTRDAEGYVVRERRAGKFSRALPLPAGTKPEDIKASMDNGILKVCFPKSHPDLEPKKIAIA